MKTKSIKMILLTTFLCVSLTGIGSGLDTTSTPAQRMETALEHFAKEYKIPLRIAHGIAYKETTYRGPADSTWNPSRRSSAGALGPMQIMPSTARLLTGDEYLGDQILRDSIEYNVELSMMLLRDDLDRLGDLKEALGCYNTGRRMVNNYALFVHDFDPNKYHLKP